MFALIVWRKTRHIVAATKVRALSSTCNVKVQISILLETKVQYLLNMHALAFSFLHFLVIQNHFLCAIHLILYRRVRFLSKLYSYLNLLLYLSKQEGVKRQRLWNKSFLYNWTISG